MGMGMGSCLLSKVLVYHKTLPDRLWSVGCSSPAGNSLYYPHVAHTHMVRAGQQYWWCVCACSAPRWSESTLVDLAGIQTETWQEDKLCRECTARLLPHGRATQCTAV